MSFYVKVLNHQGVEVLVKVSFEIYNIFEEERKDQERVRKEQERHLNDTEVDSDIVAYYHSLHKTSVEDKITYRSEIKEAMEVIQTCTPTQQRRFHLNRILGYSFAEIGIMENCSKTRVKKSVDIVAEKIKNYFSE